MRPLTLALDCGGTSIKAAILRDGEVLESGFFPFPDDSYETMTAAFRDAAQFGVSHQVEQAGVCCPGPFDFANGVSRMTHKWRGMKDEPLGEMLSAWLGGMEVRFLHDSTAYLLGEMHCGNGAGFQSPAGVMLGTGFGFALSKNRRVLVNRNQTPALILWNAPFEGGIVEDKVSRRALLASAEEGMDVKQMAEEARNGNEKAIQAFRSFGESFARVLKSYLPRECDGVVLGGGIGRSADLFLSEKTPVPVRLCAHPGDAALRGIDVFLSYPTDELIDVIEPIEPRVR